MGAGLFWGIILILIGLGIVILVLLHIDIPIFKIVIALFFVFIGLRILFGHSENWRHREGRNDIIFSESRITGNPESEEYNVIFGKGIFDFRDIDLSEGTVHVKINTIFGGSEILVDHNTPVKIKSDAVFGGAKLPEGTAAAFGNNEYVSDNFNENSNYLYIKADVVFGGVDIKRY